MFTGIVGGRGRVLASRPGKITVEHGGTARELVPGASVAVNGVCLTVSAVEGDSFQSDVVAETLRRTNLGLLRPGDKVNLELPLRADQALDGHLVLGHVDGTAAVRAVRGGEHDREASFELPAALAPFVAEKGSIAVDGVSLTVAALDDAAGSFWVALVPTTLARTVAGGYRVGTLVNLEVDIVARYVQRLMTWSAR